MKTVKQFFITSIILFATLFGSATFVHATEPQQKVYYFLHDHLGGISAVTDEQGNVVERRDYLPYGEDRLIDEADVTDYGFTGKEQDPETDLYYYGARYYDPMLGRFTSIDPLILEEATRDKRKLQNLLYNPQMLNAYTYGLNNPLFYLDLFGESPYTERWRGAGQIIDGIIGSIIGKRAMVLSGGKLSNPRFSYGFVQNIKGPLDIGMGTARLLSGKEIEFPPIMQETGNVIENVSSSYYKPENLLDKIYEKLTNGYEKGLEAIGQMIENKVTAQEFFDSVKVVATEEKDEFFKKHEKFQQVVETIKNIKNNSSEKAQDKNNEYRDSWNKSSK